MLNTHMVNFPLRRSSRIKQAKTLPGSKSDTNNNSQPVRVTRQRTATMDFIASEMVKKRLTKHASVSSDLNEATDIDVDAPTRRKLSKNTATSTKTRAANKRLTRAGSEANLPPQIKITSKTRSSSVEPESLQEQNKSQLDTPVRIRRRASILPSNSPIEEEIEEGSSTPKRLNPTITEIEELTSMDKIAVAPVLLKSKELLSLSQNKSKIRGEQVTMTKEKTVVEGQSSSEESLLRDISISDDKSADNNSSNLLESNKEEPKESLLQVEQSLIDMCRSSAKNLAEKSFIEEEKRSNKENQTSNIISDASPEKNVQPFISNISLSTKQSLASAFVSKSDEKKNKSEETNKISLNQTEIAQEKNISKKNLDTNGIIEDSNEMNLILEEQSSDRHENEAPFNVTNSDDENSEKQSTVMDNKLATDDNINDDTVQDDLFDNDDFTEQMSKKKQLTLPRLRNDNESLNSDQSMTEMLSSKCKCCPVHKHKCENYFKEIKEQQSMLIESVNHYLKLRLVIAISNNEKAHQEDKTSSFFTLVNFPIDKEEDLIRLDKYLEDETNFNVAMKELSKIGGCSVYNFIQRTLQMTITNKLAATYSWLGKQSKKIFKSLKLSDLIIGSVKKGLPNTTHKECEDAIKKWLRRAKERTVNNKKHEDDHEGALLCGGNHDTYALKLVERNVTELNPKLKLKKNLKSEKKSQVQTIVAKKGIVVTEAWNEAREAIRAAEIRLKTIKEEEESKDDENDVETRNVKMKERKKLVPSSMDTMKRLPSDVIENLSDILKKKKRKFLREEQSTDSPKKKKPKAITAKNDSELLLDVPGSSTQFSVINMQKAKKQPLRGAAAVASIRQKMLARNNPPFQLT